MLLTSVKSALQVRRSGWALAGARNLGVRWLINSAHYLQNTLFTLRAAEEVGPAPFGMAEGELDAEMVAIAKAIIAQRTGAFDPTTYRDRYQEALRELIEAKMKGLTVKPREIAAPPPVIDLMTALKRSLAQEASPRRMSKSPSERCRSASTSTTPTAKGGARELRIVFRLVPPATPPSDYETGSWS